LPLSSIALRDHKLCEPDVVALENDVIAIKPISVVIYFGFGSHFWLRKAAAGPKCKL